ncbi:MAG TPA: 30S ribosomal protein S6 [Candidatus Babeliales bacterium]|nr:30S ribosomal protein S6 [Candidatus Babeliales bacterium]
MQKYETLILATPEATDDECSALELQLSKLIESRKGKMISFDRWGKYRLAYLIARHRYGIYFLARYELADQHKQAVLAEINSLLKIKLEQLVMRFVTTALDPKVGLEYRRPMPLDERPRHVDEFLKEHKMDGLLKETRPERREAAAEMAVTSVLAAEEAPEAGEDFA